MNFLGIGKQKNPFIWECENALSDEFCQKVIEKFEGDDRKRVGVLGNSLREELKMKQSTDLNISGLEEWVDEDRTFYRSLDKHFKFYINSLNLSFNSKLKGKNTSMFSFNTGTPFFENIFPVSDSGYQIQKTCPGGFFRWHIDSAIFPQHHVRAVTYIWYLNGNFDDGETEFYDGTLIKPKTGKIVFFPATWTYLHQGREPKKNNKYICTGWMSCNIVE